MFSEKRHKIFHSRVLIHQQCYSIGTVFFIIIATLSFTAGKLVLSTEKRLVEHLLDGYSQAGIIGRPVEATHETLVVSFGISLVQILELNEKDQVLTSNIWSTYTWTDNLLKWDPNDFGGVTTVRMPSAHFWTPDIVLYNYADTRLSEQRKALLVVKQDGSIIWVPQAVFKSSCPINIKYFPFDVQKCHLKFGSWTYDGTKLDVHFFMNLSSVDMTDFIVSNEWDVLEHPAIRTVKYYPCCPEPYPALTFHLTLKRKGGFFHYIIVLPCVLLSMLTLSIFWIPPESPAKMQLGMNIYVAFFVLLLLLAESIPKAAASIPLLGAYFVLNMILITLSTFLAAIVVNLYMRGERKNRAPMWLRMITVEGFGRLLFMSGELGLKNEGSDSLNKNKKGNKENEQAERIPCKNRAGSKRENKLANNLLGQEEKSIPYSSILNKYPPPPKAPIAVYKSDRYAYKSRAQSPSASNYSSLSTEVHEIKKHVRAFVQRMHDSEERAKVTSEWRQCAIVLDRFFFIIYLTANVLSLISIFPQMILNGSWGVN